MTDLIVLEDYLRDVAGDEPTRKDAGRVILAIAEAGRTIADLLAASALSGDLDLRSHEIVLDALRAAPVSIVASKGTDTPLALDPAARLAVAINPLEGSSDLGTIFSILPALDAAASDESHFLQPGTHQVAAGFLIYGPQTALALTLGDGTRIFTHDSASGRFLARRETLGIAPEANEYAINAANWRHWDEPVRSYVSACLLGAAGPRGRDYDTRWLASLVGETFRILRRGGVYLNPGDARPGHERGRLHLASEGNPIALLVEQAGGAATDGRRRILDLRPSVVTQCVPLVFGAVREVECVRACYEHERSTEPHPLFGQRQLFRMGSTLFGARACP